MNWSGVKRLLCRSCHRGDSGFALISVLAMTAILSASGTVLMSYAMSAKQAARLFETDIYATELAEAGIYKALFCLKAQNGDKCGGSYGAHYLGESDVSFGNGRYSVEISGTDHSRTVEATGMTGDGRQKTIRVTASLSPATTPANFDYALQVGDGGLTVGNNAEVLDGGVFSGSDVVCGNGARLDGPVWVSRSNGLISNCSLYGDAHADRVTDNDLHGHDVWWLNANSQNEHVGQAHGNQLTPSPITMPDIDFDHWRALAAAGEIHVGDLAVNGGDHVTLGPIKITGNLTVNNNAVITIAGPIWVVGTITVNNNAALLLDESFGTNSTIISSDGDFNLNNNAVIDGSGDPASFILVHSASNSNAAVNIENNAGGAIFYASNGGIDIANNATVTAVAGRRVQLRNNAVIDMSTAAHDASNLRLTGEASGTWRFLPDAWREIHR